MTLTDVLADLAAGNIQESDAVNRLRDQIANGQASLEAIVKLLRTQGQQFGLDTALAENLLEMLANTTRGRSAPTPESDVPPSQTLLREPLLSSPADAFTRLRAPDIPEQAESIDADAVSTRLREPSPLADDGSATRLRPQSADSGLGVEAAAPVSASQIGPGSVLKGRFEIKSLVGRGGMGTVFRAEDRRKLEARDPNPEVAVKILNASFERHPDSLVALQREASKAQTLAHPNIATVFDFDRDGRNVFITMELLRGQTLESMIHAVRGRGIGRDAALPLIRGIAEGLAYAHRKGIVHSDLKPANIFVLEDKTPKILDFGIARAVPIEARPGPQDEFDAAARLGAYSEGYATAEMIDGADPAPADDLYALGVIVYELLTGTHPFAGGSAVKAHAAGDRVAPIRALRRREWQTVARSLAFERSARPRDAAEFQRAFFGTTWLRNSSITAIVLLAMTAGYLWYRNYEQTGPAIPFDQLPTAIQQQVTNDIAEGNKEWDFYAKQGIGAGLEGSLEHFAKAYELHKGDRAAVRGLERAADAWMRRVGADPNARHDIAQHLAETSEYLKSYPPVRDAINR